MPTIRIRGHQVDVDIRSELERFNWDRARWSENKLIAASPFRYDKSPSFFCNLDGEFAGTWSDSGAYDQEWASGGFVKLLAFLTDVSYEEAEEYLLGEYGQEWQYGERLEMPQLSLKMKADRHLPAETLLPFKFRHPYLERRGISEEVQRLNRIGFCKKSQAITIPWFSADGRLATIKYRQVRGKVFFYEKQAVPIRSLVYGMNLIYSRKLEEAVLCEAEIDAMSWQTVGKPAISVGGANFTDRQADIIKKSPLKKLAICADNDKAGEKLRSQVKEKLRGYIELSDVRVPSGYKDVNEAHMQEDITIKYVENVTIRQLSI